MKRHSGLLEPAKGYPNTFNMLLVGVFFLQRVGILPCWSRLTSPAPLDLGATCFPTHDVARDVDANARRWWHQPTGRSIVYFTKHLPKISISSWKIDAIEWKSGNRLLLAALLLRLSPPQ